MQIVLQLMYIYIYCTTTFSVVLKKGVIFNNQRMASNIIKVTKYRGPIQCIQLCSRYVKCNGINTNASLHCELLSIKDSDATVVKQGNMYSFLSSWLLVSSYIRQNIVLAIHRFWSFILYI